MATRNMRNYISPVPRNVLETGGHIQHVYRGVFYQRDCMLCNLKTGKATVARFARESEVQESIREYEMARASGKQIITFHELAVGVNQRGIQRRSISDGSRQHQQ